MTSSLAPVTPLCRCDPADTSPRVYYVWSDGDKKTRIQGVTELYLTEQNVILERAMRPAVVIGRDEVFMVTCESCSPPPTS